MLGQRDLGQRDDEAARQQPAAAGGQLAEHDVERAHSAFERLWRERLDANAQERRQAGAGHAQGQLLGHGGGVAILLGIGAAAVAVLEVDPHILDRLAAQLLVHARVDRPGQPGILVGAACGGVVLGEGVGQREGRVALGQLGRAVHAQRAGEGGEVGRVLVEVGQRQAAQPLRRAGLKQLRAAVDRMHRLARGRIAGVALLEQGVGLGHTAGDSRDRLGCERDAHGRSPVRGQLSVVHCTEQCRSAQAGPGFGVQGSGVRRYGDKIQSRVYSGREGGLCKCSRGSLARRRPRSASLPAVS